MIPKEMWSVHLVLQGSSSNQLGALWEDYDRIQVIISRLRDLQGCPSSSVPKRAEKIPCFEKWLQDHGVVFADKVVRKNDSEITRSFVLDRLQ